MLCVEGASASGEARLGGPGEAALKRIKNRYIGLEPLQTMGSPDNSHTCTYLRGLNWYTYQALEQKLLDLSRIIAIDDKNKDVWGEELASLLILIGTSVDSFFRDMEACPCVQHKESFIKLNNNINKRRSKNNAREIHWGIKNFYDAYDKIFSFSVHELNVNPISLGNYPLIKPFSDFSNFAKKEKNELEECNDSNWWHSYNGLKHDYYKHLKERATLGNVIEALGGLFLLNCIHICSSVYLIKNNYLQHRDYLSNFQKNPYLDTCDYTIELIESPYYGYLPKKYRHYPLFIQTRLYRFDLKPPPPHIVNQANNNQSGKGIV